MSQSVERMPLVAALQVLVALRGERIVVTTMGAAREWPKLSQHPLDFHYIPSAMGAAPALGLGLALAKPQRDVLVLNGDGAMLMNLGSLVTIVASRAKNMTLIMLDNGIYEVTGGQQTAAAALPARRGRYRRAGPRGGIPQRGPLRLAGKIGSAEPAMLCAMPGPRFIVLAVEPVRAYQLESPGPLPERLSRFRRRWQTRGDSVAPPPWVLLSHSVTLEFG